MTRCPHVGHGLQGSTTVGRRNAGAHRHLVTEYCRHMPAPIMYLSFPGNAREAMQFYASVFGGDLELHTYEAFSRADGPADAIAHGVLSGGPVALFGSDAAPGEVPMHLEGVSLALLGTAAPEVLHEWFDRLAESGTVVDPLGPKPWGATDGQVRDRYGLRWLVGYEPNTSPVRHSEWMRTSGAGSPYAR